MVPENVNEVYLDRVLLIRHARLVASFKLILVCRPDCVHSNRLALRRLHGSIRIPTLGLRAMSVFPQVDVY